MYGVFPNVNLKFDSAAPGCYKNHCNLPGKISYVIELVSQRIDNQVNLLRKLLMDLLGLLN